VIKLKSLLNENVGYDWANDVQNAYMEMAKEKRTIGPFKFYDAISQNIGGASNDWIARTKSGKGLVITFEPFWEGESTFEFDVVFDGGNPIESITKKYKMNVISTKDVQKDAKVALDYIESMLMKPEIKQLLEK
jgi:hypothetical protein